MAFWEVGGNWRTQMKPTLTQGAHVPLQAQVKFNDVKRYSLII